CAHGRSEVIAGLDPAIHRSSRKIFAKQMDARVISAFTRVHSPSKTGVNALIDALLPAHDPLDRSPKLAIIALWAMSNNFSFPSTRGRTQEPEVAAFVGAENFLRIELGIAAVGFDLRGLRRGGAGLQLSLFDH